MAKKSSVGLLFFLFIGIFLLASTLEPCCQAQTNPTFSIVWITDTQYLTESNPQYFDDLCRWIVENKDTYDVRLVVHTGDIVEDEGNLTQWATANQSMSILLKSGIPYCWEAGNHDYNQTCWVGNQFAAFNPQTFESKPYWVSSDFGGLDTAVHFNVDGWDCLLVNLAFRANASELSWANSLLDSHPDSHAIVTAHAYIDKDCSYDSWATDFREAVLDTHSNVFLTLGGHFHPTVGNRTRVGDRDELMFNGQDADGQLGAASARILTFDTAKGTIDVQTFSIYTNQFLQDPNNKFTLETSFRNDVAGRVGLDFQTVLILVAVVCLAACALVLRFWFGKKRSGRLDV